MSDLNSEVDALLRVWHDLDEEGRELVQDEIPELAEGLRRVSAAFGGVDPDKFAREIARQVALQVRTS